MILTSGKRFWRCRAYTILVLLLTILAFFITWKQLPDQHSYGDNSHAFKTQLIHAKGSFNFDVWRPTDEVAWQQVTHIHAEQRYTRKDYLTLNNSKSEPFNNMTPFFSVVSSSPRSSQVLSPISPFPPVPSLTEEEIAQQKTLTESSKKALLGLNNCPLCNSTGKDKLSDPAFFEKFTALEAGRRHCLKDIREQLIEDFRPLFFNVSNVVLMDVALHTNLGDSILWRAAVHLASLYGHSVDYVCVSSQQANSLYWSISQFPQCDIKTIVNLVKDNGLVLYAAGGNWGNLYRFIQQYRMKMLQILAYISQKKDYNFKVVQLPQTIHYSKKDNISIDVDDYLMHSLPPDFFTLFLRQKESFEFAKKHYGQNINKNSTADLAFLLGDLSPIGDPVVDILVMIRTDDEITLMDEAEKDEVKRFLSSSNVSFAFQDWQYHPKDIEFSRSNPTVLSEVRLNEAIKILSKGKIVISNRVHGSVMATLIGRTLLWADTKQKKIAGVQQTAFNISSYCSDENLRSFEFPAILDAAKAAVEYLAAGPGIESFT